MKSLNVGDIITTTVDITEKSGTQYYSSTNAVKAGTSLEIKKIAKKKMQVKGEYHTQYSGPHDGTIWLTIEGVQRIAGTVTAEPDREIGEMPADAGTISPDDPGLAWLWEDLIRYGKRNSLTPTIDKITDALGIPGRSRIFTAKASINGLEMTSQIEARSQREADKKLKDWIVDNA